jgi:hypothetical protein
VHFSGKKWVFPLSTLAGADKVAVNFLQYVQNFTNRPVTYFHYDSAGQYLKTYTQDYCKRASITVEQTATDAHQQNPRCER